MSPHTELTFAKRRESNSQMSLTEKLKQERRNERMNDPHAWAYEMERRIDNRSFVGGAAFFVSFVLAINVWLLWKERDGLLDRIEQLETAARSGVELPPEGYRFVE